jgi:uncharacterized coiled-coil protein SlyX
MTEEIERDANGRFSKSDPTRLTHELVEAAIMSLQRIIEVRIAAVEKAIEISHDDLVRVPTTVDRAVSQLRELLESKLAANDQSVQGLRDNLLEKIRGIQGQITETNARATLADQYKQTALDAALKSAQTLVEQAIDHVKESIKKTEDLFTKQIDAINASVVQAGKTGDKEVADVKTRLGAIEGRTNGIGQSGVFVVGAFAVISAVAAVVGVAIHFVK